jgi:hypothetical protein
MSKGLFVREATGLVREFGPLMVLMMAMNNMIGAGIWGLAVRMPYTYPGSDPVLAFVIGLIPAFFFAISFAVFTTAMRAYLASGSPNILLLGCGVLALGGAALDQDVAVRGAVSIGRRLMDPWRSW